MSERSETEREAARLDRERRRAAARGEAMPPALAPDPVWEAPADPVASEALLVEPLPPEQPAESPEPAQPAELPLPQAAPPEPDPLVAEQPDPPVAEQPVDPAPPAELPAATEPEPAPAAPLAPAPAAADPAPGLPRVAERHEPRAPVVPAAASWPEHTDEHDLPIGTVRPSAGAPGMPRHPVHVPGRRRRPGRSALLGGALLLVLLALLFAVNAIFTPLKGDGHGSVRVRIPSGASTRQIGRILSSEQVVGSGFFFALRSRIAGDDLRSGTFTMRRDMSNDAARAILTARRHPRAVAATLRVVLPEGPSRRELSARIAKAGVRGSYIAASASSADLSPRRFGAPRGTRSLEGFLFPATYELGRGAHAPALVHQQLVAFRRAIAQVPMRAARKKNLTTFDVLTIASMIEREAAVPHDRRLVAAVIYNRLKQGIPLGIDATTRYAVGNWSRPLTVSQLASPSPYNTRKHHGLPPGPIGNPGLASIRAAADPAHVSYLFYVVKPCGNGAHSFSSTDARFQRDVAAYRRARAKNGGNDPSRCSK